MRIRSIKPEFWTDEGLAKLSEPALLMAIGLLNYADDFGFFNANPLLIKAALFPLRDPSVSVQRMLTELQEAGFIKFRTGSNGACIGKVVNFLKHQRVNRPNPSALQKIYEFSESSVMTQEQLSDPSLTEVEGEGKGKGRGEGGESADAAAPGGVLPPSGVGATPKTMNKRQRLVALLRKFGCSMTFKGEDITSEWCNVINGYPVEWVETIYEKMKLRPHLPSGLRKTLKDTSFEYAAWKLPAHEQAGTKP